MNEWSHLPNAAHIDRIIESLKSHTKVWDATRDATRDAAFSASWNAALDATRDAACYAAYNAAQDAAQGVAQGAACSAVSIAAWDAAQGVAQGAAWNAAYYAARGSILALIAYDDAAKYLTMPSEQLKTWASLTEEPAAILLLPAVIAFERIGELETT
jgi:hypothetical protein